MGRGPSKRQMGVALSDDLRRELETASVRAGHSIAEEIRRRLEWTLDLEPVDEATREFVKALAILATEIELETGAAWHSHAGAHKAFRQGLLWLLDELKPEADVTFGTRLHRANPTDDPQIIGITAALEIWTMRNGSRQDRESRRVKREHICRQILEMQQRDEQEEDDKP
jgi:hypothetical protein